MTQRLPAFGPILVLALVALAALWGRALMLYPTLPDRIPIHFDGAGVPDRWVERSPAEWFLLPGIALGLVVALLSIAWWGRSLVVRTPGIVNMPQRRLFLQLSAQSRLRAFEPTRTFVATIALFLTLLFWYLIEGTAAVACGTRERLPVWPVLGFVGVTVVSIVPYWIATSRSIARHALLERVDGAGNGSEADRVSRDRQ